MKDIKHIRRDFHLVAWVLPQWSDLGVPWGLNGNFFSEIQPDLVCVSGTPYVACRRGATAPGRRASLRNVLRDVVGKNN